MLVDSSHKRLIIKQFEVIWKCYDIKISVFIYKEMGTG